MGTLAMLRFTTSFTGDERGCTSLVCSLIAAVVGAFVALSSTSTGLAELLDLIVGAL
jgi:hypothetical protein